MSTPPRAPTPKPRGVGGVTVPWLLNGFVAAPTFAPTSTPMGPSARASRDMANVPPPNASAATKIETLLMKGPPDGFIAHGRLVRQRDRRCYTDPPGRPKLTAIPGGGRRQADASFPPATNVGAAVRLTCV